MSKQRGVHVRKLSDDEVRKWRADIEARLAGIKLAFDAATGIERDRLVVSAVALCGPFRPLPLWLFDEVTVRLEAPLEEHDAWLFTGKRPKLRQRKPDPDVLRALAVIEARLEGFKGDEAFEEAVRRVAGTLAAKGGKWAMRAAMSSRRKKKDKNTPP